MEMFSLENRELIDEINNGRIAPTGVFDAVVYAKDKQIDIDFQELKELENEPNEAVVFFWNYEEKKAFYARAIDMSAGHLVWKYDVNIQMQMKYMHIDSVRFAVAVRLGQKYVCGYIRNKEAQKEDLQAGDRLICKLDAKEKEAFIAYWTEGGILCVKNRSEQDFDDEFYRVTISGIKWENTTLIGYMEVPLFDSEPEFVMQSMTTKEKCNWAKIESTREGFTGLKNVYRVSIDLSDGNGECEDAYRFICMLDNHTFRVFADEYVLEDEEIHTITEDKNSFDILAVREKNGLFALQLSEKIYPVMLSVVTAVYNTAPFLAEMINSVLMQDTKKIDGYIIGNPSNDYKKRKYQQLFEFILVDDGATDGSADILDDYARLSDKIKVIHKENGGVSSARNAGIGVAKGKYINFADSDDKLSKNFMAETLLFFENHEDEVSLVTTPYFYFDARNGEHWMNYRFKKNNCIVDLKKEPDCCVYQVNSSVFKLDNVKSQKFDENVSIAEDEVFVYELVLNNYEKIGTVSTARYYYRARSTGEESALQKSKYNPDTYLVLVERVLNRILALAKRKYGFVPLYIQYAVMGQLQWRFASIDRGETAIEVLGEKDYKAFKEAALKIIDDIDEKVILDQKNIYNEHKYYLLKRKHEPCLKQENDNYYFYFGDYKLSTGLANCYIKLEFVNIRDGYIYIEGFSMDFEPDVRLVIEVNGEEKEYDVVNRDINKYTLDEIVYYATPFEFRLELDSYCERYDISFHVKYKECYVKKNTFRFAKTMPLAELYRMSYCIKENWAVRFEDNMLKVTNLYSSNEKIVEFENQFINNILSTTKDKAVMEMIRLRREALTWKSFKKKQIWIIYDRNYMAGDNGEAFFQYLSKIKDNEIEVFFVLDKNSDDFDRVSQIGKVLPLGSKKHYLMVLIADVIISSSGAESDVNPWIGNKRCEDVVRDLLSNHKYVFLQHGIIMDDISEWLNRYNKNIDGFICGATREAQSILDEKYYYKPENVWLTGLPRHDKLYSNPQKLITIMPTWRNQLSSGISTHLRDDFKNSDYFKFFNSLLNSERLLEEAKKYGYKIAFMPHPNIGLEGIKLFDKNDDVIFWSPGKKYVDVFAESSLILTDYSSSIVDFAMLYKPIVFCQFDKEDFFKNHTRKKGYFDYERDGFGEVTYEMNDLIDVAVEYMKNNCKMHEPYKKRIDKFFAFHDKNNCERVYSKIKEILL